MGKSKNKNAEMTPEEIFAEKYKSMTAKEMKDFQKNLMKLLMKKKRKNIYHQ